MTEKQLREVLDRIRATGDLDEVTRQHQIVRTSQELLRERQGEGLIDLRDYLNSSSLPFLEDLDDSLSKLPHTELREQVDEIEGALDGQERKSRAEALRALLSTKGYKVECQWRSDGWHFSFKTLGQSFRSIVIFSEVVLWDWPASKILAQLEQHNWERELENNKGQKTLHFNCDGFQRSCELESGCLEPSRNKISNRITIKAAMQI